MLACWMSPSKVSSPWLAPQRKSVLVGFWLFKVCWFLLGLIELRTQQKHCDVQGGPPTSYKWSYKPYKWPYKWVTGVITLLIGVITPFITSRGPTLYYTPEVLFIDPEKWWLEDVWSLPFRHWEDNVSGANWCQLRGSFTLNIESSVSCGTPSGRFLGGKKSPNISNGT